jgi:hypothetical protein
MRFNRGDEESAFCLENHPTCRFLATLGMTTERPCGNGVIVAHLAQHASIHKLSAMLVRKGSASAALRPL